jgi:hypothetical protein
MIRWSSFDSETVTVHVPIAWQKRGPRKRVIVPVDSVVKPPSRYIRDPLVNALVRAYRWRSLLETGAHDSIGALAAAEKVDKSYVSKILRLTTLAPRITDMILDGTQPEVLSLHQLLQPFPSAWRRQMANWVASS